MTRRNWASFGALLTGRNLADQSGMRTRERHDTGRAGPLPLIQLDGDDIVFSIEVTGEHPGTRLVLRCTDAGEVTAAIDPHSALHTPHSAIGTPQS
jgi:hypothetical protein